VQSSVVFERLSGRLSKYETNCVERHGSGQSGAVGWCRRLECPSGRRPSDRRGASGGATSGTRATPATTATAASTAARRPRTTRPGHGGGDQSYPFAETTAAAETPIASPTTTSAATAI